MKNDKEIAKRPIAGIGIGLRAQHVEHILLEQPKVAWFEVLSDNYLNHQGLALDQLVEISTRYPLVMHSVGMSLGSSDPLNIDYLTQLKQLAQQIKPAWISDHLCWISVDSEYLHQLMPLPYNDETVNYVANRIKRIQDFFGESILIENVSSYLDYANSTMPEWEFVNRVLDQADCSLLLDVNNIYVSGFNQNFDPYMYLQQIEGSRIKQIHLAGFEDHQNYLLDSHDAVIAAPVWDLYHAAIKRFGKIPSLIEWDAKIPEFSVLQAEAKKAEEILPCSLGEAQRNPGTHT